MDIGYMHTHFFSFAGFPGCCGYIFTTFIMLGSFQGPLSDLWQPPYSSHLHLPPKNSGNSLHEYIRQKLGWKPIIQIHG
jgi:hypothetical protein